MSIYKNISLLSTICFYILFGFSINAQVVINEYSASNLTDYLDNFDKTEDWVELHNTSPDPVDLSGWYISDKENNPLKWEIPDGISIEGNDFLRFWCSSRDTVVWGGHYHTNFKLTQTKDNETLVLSNPDGNIVQVVPLELTLLSHSRCLETDGGNQWLICTEPTLGESNNNALKFANYTAQPEVSLGAGFYAEEQMAFISSSPDTTVSIHYTTDGHTPTESSPIYETGDTIFIQTTQVLKARAFSTDSLQLPGKVVFNTYFIDEDFTLAVMSVAADEVIDLANGDGVLRPIGSLEYFNQDKTRTAISYGELNRHGQDSWVNPHRSIDWVSRDEMGYNNVVKEKLFNYSDRDEYQRVMFRASGDDNYPAINDAAHEGSTHIRDEYVHALAHLGGMKLEVRAVERIIVFLNGQYWGVYGMRERPVDHDFTKEYFDQEKYDLQFLNTWGETWAEYGGVKSFVAWEGLRDFILDKDMSLPENYQIVKDNIRLLSLIDYFIANMNSVASDWLNYNTGWWRGLNPEGNRKKWGYILWDNDATFDYYINYSGVPNTDPDAEPCDINEISDFMDQFFDNSWTGENVGKHEKIFLKLQEENDEFRQLYYSRQADLMNTVYTCENMLTTLDSMLAVIEPEMPRHIDRWGGTMNEWEQNVVQLRSFIEERCTLLDDGMVNCFDLTGPYDLTLMVEPPGIGEIDLNTLDIETFPWTGAYFGNMPNLIKAKSNDDDYVFLEWKSLAGNAIFPDSSAIEAQIELTQADTLIAVFGFPNQTVEIESGLAFTAYPTIVSNELTVEFELDEALPVNLSMYSVLGNKVADFSEINGQTLAGKYRHQLKIGQRQIAPGLYFLNFKAGTKQGSIKISVVR